MAKLLKNRFLIIACGCLLLLCVCSGVIGGGIYYAGVAAKNESERIDKENKEKEKKAEEEKKQKQEVEKKQAEEKEAGKFNNPFKIGQQVKVGSVSWKVTGAKNLGQKLTKSYGGYYTTTCDAGSGNRIIKVDFELVNQGEKSVYNGSQNPKLIDSKKKAYDFDTSNVYSCLEIGDKYYPAVTLNPGVLEKNTVYFKVANNASGLRLKILEAGFYLGEGNYEYIGLGI